MKGMQMFDEPALKSALARIGYRRIKKHVYQAEWSTEVEHFLEFQLVGTPKSYLQAAFGFRNRSADAFGQQSIETYGPSIYRQFNYLREPTDCWLRFSLGQLAGWGLPPTLPLTPSGPALAAKIKDDVERALFPVVRNVTSIDRLLPLVLADAEPCLWNKGNCAARAAIITYLARRLGYEKEDIRRALKPFERIIEPHLRDGSVPNASAYIERIIDDATLAVGRET